ncbi:MAG TPA: GNAT family N-acetyltransferase [Planctomycetota bacterium]|nr:GNAT family N-acetyltransferase [Planctomycetota bacterium]
MGLLAVAVTAVRAIRAASAADSDAIASLLRPEWHDTMRRAIAGGGCAVAEIDGRIVAYVCRDETFYGNGWVSLLYVREEARRRGLGEALMRHAMASCRTEKLFTSTNLSNGPMQALLGKLGFELTGVIHNLDPGDPELVYLRRGAG